MRGQFTRVKIESKPVTFVPDEEIELGSVAVGDSIQADFEVVAEAEDAVGVFRFVSALDAPSGSNLGWSSGRMGRVMSPTHLPTLESLGLVTYDRNGVRVAHFPVIADGKPSKIGTDYQMVAEADGQYLRPKIKGGSGKDTGQNVGDDSWAIEWDADTSA